MKQRFLDTFPGLTDLPAQGMSLEGTECVNSLETDLFRIQGASDWFSPAAGRSVTG
jgi:hypothetical protein